MSGPGVYTRKMAETAMQDDASLEALLRSGAHWRDLLAFTWQVETVSGAQRAALLPDTPTIAEAGVAGYAFESRFALAAPAGVPPTIMRRIADEVRALVARQDMQQLFARNAITPGVVAGAVVQQSMVDDFERMGKLVRNSGATAQ